MKNAITWLKNNWILVISGAAIVFLLWQRSVSEDAYSSLLKAYNVQSEAHLKEIKALEDINKAKDKRLRELSEKYKSDVKRLEEEYASLLEKIKKESTRRRKKIVKEAYRDPTTLTDAITETFSIPYYIAKDTNE